MTPQEIYDVLKDRFADAIVDFTENVDPWIRVEPESIAEVCGFLRDDEKMKFESLMCLGGVDFDDHMTVVYNLGSYEHKHKVTLKVDLSRDEPRLPTVENVWHVANWHEREAYDMYGIVFEGHSDLRRILCPDDWEGWPLRKDYQVQEFYRGIKVEV